jgi:tRNA dimethylallyltransferase
MGPRVWLIAGPTASGKSALALRLAEATGAEILNADSMQIYQGLRVLTAAPDDEALARAPHHLYRAVPPTAAWSAGAWLRAATDVLEAVRARGRPAVVVGGTGLYLRALTQGLAPVPEVPEAARAAAAALWAEAGEAGVRAALAAGDPSGAARIATGDRQRLLRALEVLQSTGSPLEAWRAETRTVLPDGLWRGVVIEPDRVALYQRCEARLAHMVEDGVLAEVKALLELNLDPQSPAMKAVGVREFARHLRGEESLDVALAQALLATRRYAKRQLTWFRHQTPGWDRLGGLDPEETWDALRALLGPDLGARRP